MQSQILANHGIIKEPTYLSRSVGYGVLGVLVIAPFPHSVQKNCYVYVSFKSLKTNGLSAVSLSRQRHDILDFSCRPLSRVLHVTLANWQRFGFEFHLRSSPSAYSGLVNISRPAEYFTACYTVLKRPNKVETAVHGCNLAFSLNSIVSLPR